MAGAADVEGAVAAAAAMATGATVCLVLLQMMSEVTAALWAVKNDVPSQFHSPF